MTNMEYLEMVEKEIRNSAFKPEYKISMYMKSIARSLAIIADGEKQEPNTGYWIVTGGGVKCSKCNEIQYGHDNYRFYCANCGADMRGGKLNV